LVKIPKISAKIFIIIFYKNHSHMNITKIALALVVTGAIVAVALAPMLLGSALATKTVTCTNGGGQTKDCGTPPAKVETCTAGNGAEPQSCNGAK
jgi:hypothetical protein